MAQDCDMSEFGRKNIKSIRKEVASSLTDVASTLNYLPKNTRDIWIGNYIEYMGYAAVGQVDSLHLPFFYSLRIPELLDLIYYIVLKKVSKILNNLL